MAITKPTVLILGAGASEPYGFPLGRGLRDTVCAIRKDSGTYNLLYELGHSDSELQAFLQELRFSGYTSVDLFLEHNPDFLEIGKHAMASLLLPAEKEQRLFPPAASRSHWYEYLANTMAVGTDEWRANRLSVVTFNYDRSFEHYFTRVIAQRKGVAPPRAYELLCRVPIIHVHGALGEYLGREATRLEYGARATPENVARAAERILVVSEVKDTLPTFDAAANCLKEAERVLFLGFGFLEANVRRLRVFNATPSEGTKRSVAGTSKGIHNREWQRIVKHILNGQWNGPHISLDILSYLQMYVDLD